MWEEDLEDGSRRKVAWLIGIIAACAAAIVGWYWYASHHQAPAEPVAPPPPPTAGNSEPQIEHPMPEAGDATALPALNDSDQVVHDSLAGVIGRNLVASQGDVTTIGDANFARYAPLVHVIEATDVKALAVVYTRLYPLFQQSYEDLGYPGKYFNDRLVLVIDHLLQTPEVAGPIPVVQPKVFYEYADPNLESRSAGQKLLIRMGPANARIIKAKLRDFRTEIVKKNNAAP
jgi:hypothetical protein